MSYNGIGLSTARGSGTNGYIVRNLSTLKPRRNDYKPADPYDNEPLIRKPNAELVLHEQKRSIEVKCATLQDELEDEGMAEDEIDKQVGALRERLTSLLKKATEAAARAVTQAAEREAAAKEAAEARAQEEQGRLKRARQGVKERTFSFEDATFQKKKTAFAFQLSLTLALSLPLPLQLASVCFAIATPSSLSLSGLEASPKTAQGSLRLQIAVEIAVGEQEASEGTRLPSKVTIKVHFSLPFPLLFLISVPLEIKVRIAPAIPRPDPAPFPQHLNNNYNNNNSNHCVLFTL
ncbi:RNA-splicing factor [Mortierella antarctica]|nr:RNA-splicing factor [Mortierella antarctica]